MAIPKKIHYCWFGRGPMPEAEMNCINSWKEHLPDYELVLWNEDNFDVSCNKYVKEAYEAKKFAFVTDYVRLFALYQHGGIYMDTDVEVVKSFDSLLTLRAFMGYENDHLCGTGTIGAEKGHQWIGDLLKEYEGKAFILGDGSFDQTPNTETITEVTINKYGWKPNGKQQELKEGLTVFPFEYFCVMEWETGKVRATTETYAIHHYSGSWQTGFDKFKNKIINLIGPGMTQFVVGLKRKLKRI